MIIKSLASRIIDLSSTINDNTVGPPLRLSLKPGQLVIIDDSYRSVAAMQYAINNGLLEIVSYDNEAGGYVVGDQLNSHASTSSGIHGVTGSVVGSTDEQILFNKIINSYAEGVTDLGTASGDIDFDLSLTNVFEITLDGDTTFTFSNAKNTGNSNSFVIYLTGGGDYIITWPSSVYWPSGVVPPLSTSAEGTDILLFTTIDNGIIWHGVIAQASSASV